MLRPWNAVIVSGVRNKQCLLTRTVRLLAANPVTETQELSRFRHHDILVPSSSRFGIQQQILSSKKHTSSDTKSSLPSSARVVEEDEGDEIWDDDIEPPQNENEPDSSSSMTAAELEEVRLRYQSYASEFLESPWEQRIPVHVLDEHGKFLGKFSKAEARRKAFDGELVLVHLKGADIQESTFDANAHDESTLPVYQLMSRTKAVGIEQKMKDSRKRETKKQRQMRIFAKIETADLTRKINKIHNWLDSGNDVRINIVCQSPKDQAHKAEELSNFVQQSIPSDIGKVTTASEPGKGSPFIKIMVASTKKTT